MSNDETGNRPKGICQVKCVMQSNQNANQQYRVIDSSGNHQIIVKKVTVEKGNREVRSEKGSYTLIPDIMELITYLTSDYAYDYGQEIDRGLGQLIDNLWCASSLLLFPSLHYRLLEWKSEMVCPIGTLH